MQRYENKSEEQCLAKQFLLEIIDFIRMKIENDSLTMEEMNSIARTIMGNLELYATIDDLSAHYGKSKDAINGVIKRRMIKKPRRNVVLYSFSAFQKIIPSSWLKPHNQIRVSTCNRDKTSTGH